MRFYDIQIGGDYPIQYTSFVNGVGPDPGALKVELDIPVAPFATPFGNPWVRIWGISIQQISQAAQLDGAPISVYGGMSPGLPLAQAAFNDHQQGLLAKGTIFQAYGNWIGTNQTLDLILLANSNQVNALNIVLNWKKGAALGPAIQNCLQTALPNTPINMAISPNLVLSRDDVGPYTSFEALGQHIKSVTQPILGGSYPGVDISLRNGQFYVYDGTYPAGAPTAKAINFYDLIGQPTWIEFPTIQFSTVMRADLSVGSIITLPPGQFTTTTASQSQFRQKTAQQGKFQIVAVHHVGNSRAPGASNWITVFNANPYIGS
jgi:hypothetical protein